MRATVISRDGLATAAADTCARVLRARDEFEPGVADDATLDGVVRPRTVREEDNSCRPPS